MISVAGPWLFASIAGSGLLANVHMGTGILQQL